MHAVGHTHVVKQGNWVFSDAKRAPGRGLLELQEGNRAVRHDRTSRRRVNTNATVTDEEPLGAGTAGSLTEYKDNLYSRTMINYFTDKMSKQVGVKPTTDGYDAFIEMSRAEMQGRNPEQQKQIVMDVLFSLVPRFVAHTFRAICPPTEWACVLNSYFATVGFYWLVGEMTVKPVEITKPDGSTRIQNSKVHITKCRYLEHSGCTALCVNLCKVPTEEFFNVHFGMPLYMEPNVEDGSCSMTFGQSPPPPEDDPILSQPCLAACSIMPDLTTSKCPKLR